MTEKLKLIIEGEVRKLPEEMQEAINSLDWAKLTEGIGAKFLLTEEEINDLQVETLLILTGIEDGNYYAWNIENNVGTSKSEAEGITQEVFQKIFAPISDMLIESIKKNPKNKDADAKQTLYFILSGGDYSTLVEGKNPENDAETVLPVFSIKKENLKENFNI